MFEFTSIGQLITNIVIMLANWVVGWFIIERIRLIFKGIRTRREWNEYYKEQSNDYRNDSRQ